MSIFVRSLKSGRSPFNCMATILCFVFLMMSCVYGRRGRSGYPSIYKPNYMTIKELRNSFAILPPQKFTFNGKVYGYKNFLFVNERNKGIHVFDNSSPKKPKKIGFLQIPGNLKFIIKDDILYADSYIDLLVIDITKLQNTQREAVLLKRVENVYPNKPILQLDLFRECDVPYPTMYFEDIDTTMGVVLSWNESQKRTKTRKNTIHIMTGEAGRERDFIIHDTLLYITFGDAVSAYDISDPAETKHLTTSNFDSQVCSMDFHQGKLLVKTEIALVSLSDQLDVLQQIQKIDMYGFQKVILIEPYKEKFIAITAGNSTDVYGRSRSKGVLSHVETDKGIVNEQLNQRVFSGLELISYKDFLFVGGDFSIYVYDLQELHSPDSTSKKFPYNFAHEIDVNGRFCDMDIQGDILSVSTIGGGLIQYDISERTKVDTLSIIPIEW